MKRPPKSVEDQFLAFQERAGAIAVHDHHGDDRREAVERMQVAELDVLPAGEDRAQRGLHEHQRLGDDHQRPEPAPAQPRPLVGSQAEHSRHGVDADQQPPADLVRGAHHSKQP